MFVENVMTFILQRTRLKGARNEPTSCIVSPERAGARAGVSNGTTEFNPAKIHGANRIPLFFFVLLAAPRPAPLFEFHDDHHIVGALHRGLGKGGKGRLPLYA